MNGIRQLLRRVQSRGKRRSGLVGVQSMGRTRQFAAYDVGIDTYVIERGIANRLSERLSVLIVEKPALRRHSRGWVFTISTGNHSVAAFPLLDGRFWSLSALTGPRRSAVLSSAVVCANVSGGSILELSQRDVPTKLLVSVDEWLLGVAGMDMASVVMADRNLQTIEHYRRLGQEWRVKPLVWTESGMRTALMASRKRIASKIEYFHSARGVHFLTYSEFARFVKLAETDLQEFVSGLKELVNVFEGNDCSFTRMPKFRGHHEIEFFGVRRGFALVRLIPALERLMESVALGRIDGYGIAAKAQDILELFQSLLSRCELADENSPTFIDTLYMYITGEIYSVVGEGTSPAFDDRRSALPGATFADGKPKMHALADSRTRLLLTNLCGMTSKDEVIEYANVYELRDEESEHALGEGATREVVYKTNRRPLENSLIEKRLSSDAPGYSGYLLARIGALRALGIALSDFYLLLRRETDKGGRQCDYYIRHRCEGEPMDSIPENYLRGAGGGEDCDVLLRLLTLMGDAAAQNMAMKKFVKGENAAGYDTGKEIYEFGYDLERRRMMPTRVSTCSVRGSFGWPHLAESDDNLSAMEHFYFSQYATAVRRFVSKHPAVNLKAAASAFRSGFEYRTNVLAWQLSVMRDRFAAFSTPVPPRYRFARKWHFAMWALERQLRNVKELERKIRS